MSKKMKSFLLSLRNHLYKNILILVMFMLPKRVSFTFISLNILAIFYKLRNIEFRIENMQIEYLSKLLNTIICKEVLLLPEYTLNWIWDEKFLNELTEINGKKYRIYEVIADKNLFNRNVKKIIDMFIQKLPLLFKIKFNLNSYMTKNNKRNQLTFRHNLTRFLIHAYT